MISIILPTIDKESYYTKQILLDIPNKVKSEYEIILLDGTELVNEKWNIGVSRAKGEYVWIINDDIILSDGLDIKLLQVLKSNKIACPVTTVGKYRWNLPFIAPRDNLAGWCFMMKRSDYINIPTNLKLWFGDDFLYQSYNKDVGWNGACHHFESQTINLPERKQYIDSIIEEDKKQWKILKANNNWKDERWD